MNAIQDTSRMAYHDIKPQISERQKAVLAAIELHGPMTNSEIAQVLGWPINTVTPRTNELVKRGSLALYQRRHCSVTGRTAIEWGKTAGLGI